MTVKVHELFGPTIQGEGAWAGVLVDFVRLFGCPVGCPWCDTGYADGGHGIEFQSIPIADIVERCQSSHVVISGGEPFINPHLPNLSRALHEAGHLIHIETSGAYWQDLSVPAWITLSPKEHLRPQFPVTPQAWAKADEVKIVIETGQEIEFYQDRLTRFDGPVYIQPEWNSKDKAVPTILSLLTEHPEWRMSTQLHKFIGVQ